MPNQFSSQQTNNTAAPRERLHWVDFAKAAAIALVVLYHVGGAGMDYLFPNPGGPSARFWPLLNDVLLPVRMPLFFVTAGLLAHHTLGRPWPQLLRTRVLVLLWPYFIWSIFFATVAGFAYRPSDPKSYMADHLLGALYAASAYWFLLALVIFFAAARLLRRAPMPLLLVTFAVVLAAPALQPLVQ
ncbi:MAG: acyltransferase family protein, partial [Microbacterium sp.]